MQFEDSYSQNADAGCCPECSSPTPVHCAHCPRNGETDAARLPDGYDYSHLVRDPVKQHDTEIDAALFDGLLTDYDRILLQFGMHILWEL
jgi:hypothetical protein